jgi:hypothetical protein
MTEPDRSETPKRDEPWKRLALRLGVILSIVTVAGMIGGAVVKVALYHRALELAAQKEAEASRLYLDGAPSTKDCAEAVTSKRAVGCFLMVKPANPEIRLLRTIVTYPAAATWCGCSGAIQIGNPVPITVDSIKDYLVRRAYTFTKAAHSSGPLQVNLPIVISTEYDYKGKTNVDISAYFLSYRILRDTKSLSVIPAGLVYCGHLSRIPTFVVDPWIPTELGRSDQKTSSVLVECLEKATWFDSPKGRFRVTTDIAAGALKGGGFELNSVPAFVKDFKLDALEGASPQVTTAMITG